LVSGAPGPAKANAATKQHNPEQAYEKFQKAPLADARLLKFTKNNFSNTGICR
jgi:hypothetical protein